MPIYEYQCKTCGSRYETLCTKTHQIKHSDQMFCIRCGSMADKVMSSATFRVTGFNAKNGYNLPNYEDVINADGHAKEEWGKNK